MIKAANKNTISAKVIKNSLIVSSMTSETPRLIRIDLNKTPAVNIGLKEHKNEFTIVMTHADNTEDNIGTFGNKESALHALQVITDAIFHDKPRQKGIGFKKWFKRLVKFILALFAIVVVIKLATIIFLSNRYSQPDMAKSLNTMPPAQTGKPLPLDELLGNDK